MSKFSIEQRCEIIRKSRELVRKRDDVAADRAGAPGKTRDDALVADEAPVVTDAVSVQPDASTWSGWLEQYVEHRFDIENDVVGEFIGEREADLRAHFSQEIKALKRALEREQAKQLRDLREKAAATRERLEQEDAVTRYEIGLVRRELAMLREELGLERGLKTLHEEIASARAEIPKVPTIEAEHVELRRELAAVKKTLGNVRVDQSLTAYGLSQLERKQARSAAATVVEFETSSSRLVVGNLHPDAAVALKQFAAGVVDARDGGAILFSGPGGTA